MRLLERQLFSDGYDGPNAYLSPHGADLIEQLLHRAYDILSAFCEDISLETSTSPLTIERRNAIAYEALMAFKMKDGMSIGKNTKREMGAFTQDLTGVNPEEGKQFTEAFVADFIGRAMGKK